MFDPLLLQPQSVGDIVGRGFRVFRNNAPLFLKAQVVPAIVMTVGHILALASASFGFKDLHAYGAIFAGLGGLFVGFLISTVGFWLLMIKQLAFIRLGSDFALSYDDALQWATSKQWSMIGLGVLFYAFVIAIFVAWTIEITVSALLIAKLPAMGIPGLLLGCLGVIASFFILSFYYMLIMAALATESESWNVVISHSFSLMMRDLGRVCGFSLLLTLIALLLSFTLSLPVFFLQTAETLRNGIVAGQKPALLNMPLYLMVISQVWHTGINMVLLPIIFIGYGLLYRDLRVRQEGLDVLQGVQLLTQQQMAN